MTAELVWKCFVSLDHHREPQRAIESGSHKTKKTFVKRIEREIESAELEEEIILHGTF